MLGLVIINFMNNEMLSKFDLYLFSLG